MWIREVELKNFGKFREKRILLSEGINIIYGENESGKSTLYTAIKSLLFGMTRGRGRAAKTDVFSQYEPWEEPNYYAGRIRFVCERRSFSLERYFDKYGKAARLFCEDDGEELNLSAGDLEVLLEDMDVSEFENTVSIGQMKVETDSTLVASIKNYAANYFSTGDSDIDLTKALEILKTRKKCVEKEIRELRSKKQEKRDKLELEASYVWKDMRSIEKEMELLSEDLDETKQKVEGLKEEGLDEEKQQGIHPVVFLIMLVVVVVSLFLIPKPWNYFCSIVLALAEVLFVWNKMKDNRRKRAKLREEEREEWEDVLGKQMWQLERLSEELQDKKIQHLNLKEQIDELDEVGNEFKEQEKRRQALELAEEMILRSSREMQVHLEERINERVSTILSELTAGKYEKVWVDENLHICVYSEGRKVNIEQLSRGTIEQIYFSLRMAAIEIMHDEEYPVIVDDAFVYYDDVRLEAMLKWLKDNRRQVIIFTCQKREEQILKKNGIIANYIMI